MGNEKEHKRNRLIIWILAGIAALLIIGGGITAFAVHYYQQNEGIQDPDKVVQYFAKNKDTNFDVGFITLSPALDDAVKAKTSVFDDPKNNYASKKVLVLMKNKDSNNYVFNFKKKKVYVLKVYSTKTVTKKSSYDYVLAGIDHKKDKKVYTKVISGKDLKSGKPVPDKKYSIKQYVKMGGSVMYYPQSKLDDLLNSKIDL